MASCCFLGRGTARMNIFGKAETLPLYTHTISSIIILLPIVILGISEVALEYYNLDKTDQFWEKNLKLHLCSHTLYTHELYASDL